MKSLHFGNRGTNVALTLLGVAVLVIGCASEPKVRVDKDSRANFNEYKTYAWLEAKQSAPGATPAKVGTIANQRVRGAVAAALQAKGYAMDEAHPQVRISTVLNVYERPKQSGMRIGLGAGGGSGNVGGGVGLSLPVGKRNEAVAAMTIDVIDATRNAQVWTGSYETVVKEKDASDAEVQKLADIILAKYPAR